LAIEMKCLQRCALVCSSIWIHLAQNGEPSFCEHTNDC